jgi:histidinol-phosphate aminotransferase
VKLNTNENPFPPSPKALLYARDHTRSPELYSDPEGLELRKALAFLCGVRPEEIILTNGSDEVLNLAFMAFCDADHPGLFPDITYGFYPVYCQLNGVPSREFPLGEDFSIDPEDYRQAKGTVFIANPNAPTGKLMDAADIESIVASDPDRIVVVDEAYIDFGGVSALPLLEKYDNLLIVQTFSKSRSMAGARLGFAMGSEEIIRDLKTIQYSTNPYNVNRMTAAAGIAALREQAYYDDCCRRIGENREWTKGALRDLGFTVLDSSANFLFARSDRIGGEALYLALKERGILIRHFTAERIKDYNRITIGTREQMETFLAGVRECLEDKA